MSKKRALISVSDKSGLTDFAKFLEEKNYELIYMNIPNCKPIGVSQGVNHVTERR